jgi:hypothetical protein
MEALRTGRNRNRPCTGYRNGWGCYTITEIRILATEIRILAAGGNGIRPPRMKFIISEARIFLPRTDDNPAGPHSKRMQTDAIDPPGVRKYAVIGMNEFIITGYKRNSGMLPLYYVEVEQSIRPANLSASCFRRRRSRLARTELSGTECLIMTHRGLTIALGHVCFQG